MGYYDLSQPIDERMPNYPGDPLPQVRQLPDIEPPWRVSFISLGSHNGTHIDSPFHCIPGGKSIDQFEVSRFILPGVMVDIPNLEDYQPIGADKLIAALPDDPVSGAVLIRTGWSRFWYEERYWKFPYLSVQAAEFLVELGVSLVGIDTLSIDPPSGDDASAHYALLGNDILIVENLRLDQLLPGRRYHFSFLPLLIPGADGSPIRAVAWDS